MDETACIQHARQGDLAAFNRLALAHQDRVYRLIYWLVGDPAAAERLTQQTFLLAYARLKSFPGGELGDWLLGLACRLCLDEARPVRFLDPQQRAWTAGDRADETRLLERLDRLPVRQRAVLTLVDLQGYGYAQTADILAISTEEVSRCLAGARTALAQSGGEG